MSEQPTQEHKGAAFRALHAGEAFVIPNPWDAGSARVLEALGFRALATTSSGFAFTLGRPDGGATIAEVVEHVRALTARTTLPLSVDLEDGHDDPAAALARIARAGAVGGSIEDFDRERQVLYPLQEAEARLSAAVAAADELDFPFTLTARAENHIRGNPDLDDTIARLQAYERVGADVLYAPGLRDVAEIQAVCAAVSRPVNVLARPDLTVAAIAQAGARRISLGGGLAWVAAQAMTDAATRLRDTGEFTFASGPQIDGW